MSFDAVVMPYEKPDSANLKLAPYYPLENNAASRKIFIMLLDGLLELWISAVSMSVENILVPVILCTSRGFAADGVHAQ